MTTVVAERTFVDTNVWLTATAPARHLHAQARAVVESWPAAGRDLVTSGQVVREYLAVATRPIDVNGLGLTTGQALDNVSELLQRLTVLEETRAVTDELLTMLRSGSLSDKQVHDANIVAAMRAHGVRRLVTDNGKHFAPFDGVQIIDLAGVVVS